MAPSAMEGVNVDATATNGADGESKKVSRDVVDHDGDVEISNGVTNGDGDPKNGDDDGENGDGNGDEGRGDGDRSNASEVKPDFASPSRAKSELRAASVATQNDIIRATKDSARLSEVVQETTPAVLRKVLHSNWRAFLFSENDIGHVSFMLRAILKNAGPEVLEKAAKEGGLFKGPLLQAAVENPKIIERILASSDVPAKYPAQVDGLFRTLERKQALSLLSEEILDEICEQRLKSVSASKIQNWLAKHRRLGFTTSDKIEDGDEFVHADIAALMASFNDASIGSESANRASSVVTQGPHPPARMPSYHDLMQAPPAIPPQFQQYHPQPPVGMQLSSNPPGPGVKVCRRCRRQFASVNGYNYHCMKNICTKPPPGPNFTGYKFSCDTCGQGFTTKQGREYHNLKKVCEDCETIPPWDHVEPGTLSSHQASSSNAPSTSTGNAIPRPRFRSSGTALASPVASPVATPASGLPARPPMRTPALGSGVAQPSVVSAPSNLSKSAPIAIARQLSLDSDVRRSPSDMDPIRREQMEQEIRDEDARYEAAKIQALQLPLEDQAARLTSLKNGNASKKSNIRKRFGVTLRMRKKDKEAAAASSSLRPRTSNAAIIPNPSLVATSSGFSPINSIVPAPGSGFSPINTAHKRKTNGWQAQNGLATRPPPGSPYNNSPYNTHNSPYARPVLASTPGLVSTNKRPRSAGEDEGASRPSPGPPSRPSLPPLPRSSSYRGPYGAPGPHGLSHSLPVTTSSSREGSSDSVRFPKKMLAEAQSKWDAMQPSKRNSSSSTAPSPAPPSPTIVNGGDTTMTDAASPTSSQAQLLAETAVASTTSSSPHSSTDVVTSTEPFTANLTKNDSASIVELSDDEDDEDEDEDEDDSDEDMPNENED
ncbi:hypothetical protein BJ875DRAFT_495287 [Amylocarpus encephaloides]|uniref:C2H2-type domain-containing protein n=1 Tax=Amylocarpus encephaloides TaxID=45428 RepID=A0A9P8C6D4_9HELO|nr:hypothetical protein BJ875DRAFT_495287 [Amylocarpus encephaloides]